jgi:hypothetical protein
MTELYIPLQFWFNRNTELALPIISIGKCEYWNCDLNEQIEEISSDKEMGGDDHVFSPECSCDECYDMMLIVEI